MTNINHLTRTMTEGILLGENDQSHLWDLHRTWTFAHEGETATCVIPCGDLLQTILNRPLSNYIFHVIRWPPNHGADQSLLPIIVHADPLSGDDVLRHLPLDLCPIEGVLGAIVDLIDSLEIRPLRQFVQHVFRRRDVATQFWTMPAAAKHHHAFRGGLAAHTLEVAIDLARQGSLEAHERELTIAGGLLHDIGKVWSYTNDMFPNPASRAMGHELIGLSRLEEPLKILEKAWPDGAYAMRVLLNGSGRMRHDGTLPSALIARLRAADQRSCEQDRSRTKGTGVWVPKAWSGPVRMPALVPLHKPDDLAF